MKTFEEAKRADERESTEKMKRFRRTFRTALIVVAVSGVLISLVFFPQIWNGWRQESPRKAIEAAAKSAAGAVCPNVVSFETRKCMLSTKPSNLIRAEEGPVTNGMRFCASDGTVVRRVLERGKTFWELRAEAGTLESSYRFFPGDRNCADVSL